MDDQLMFIGGFIFVALVALIVSLTFIYEKDGGVHEVQHRDIAFVDSDIKHMELANNSQHPIRELSKLKEKNKLRSGKIILDSTMTIDELNNKFAQRYYIVRPSLYINYIDTDGTNAPQRKNIEDTRGWSPFVFLNGDDRNIILVAAENHEYYIRFPPDNLAHTHEADNKSIIDNDGNIYGPNFTFDTNGRLSFNGETIIIRDEYLIPVNQGDGLQLHWLSIGTALQLGSVSHKEDNLSNLFYFGLTSDGLYPLPDRSIPFLSNGDTLTFDSKPFMDRMPAFQQILGPAEFDTDTLNSGLFAKVYAGTATQAETANVDGSDFSGFKDTPDHSISLLRDDIVSPHEGSPSAHGSLYYSTTTDGIPCYSIYVILANEDNNTKTVYLKDINNVKGTQTIFIFGSKYSTIENKYPAFVKRAAGIEIPGQTEIPTIGGKIYLPVGQTNMNAIAFMKFNTDGFSNDTPLSATYTKSEGWSIAPPASGTGGAIKGYIPINFGKVYTYKLKSRDYQNFYNYDTDGKYTHYHRNPDNTGTWVPVNV